MTIAFDLLDSGLLAIRKCTSTEYRIREDAFRGATGFITLFFVPWRSFFRFIDPVSHVSLVRVVVSSRLRGRHVHSCGAWCGSSARPSLLKGSGSASNSTRRQDDEGAVRCAVGCARDCAEPTHRFRPFLGGGTGARRVKTMAPYRGSNILKAKMGRDLSC